MRKPISVATATAALLTAALLSGCGNETRIKSVSAPDLKLTSFDSCDTALAGFKKAATATVGSNGFPDDTSFRGGEDRPATSDAEGRTDAAPEAPQEKTSPRQEGSPDDSGSDYSGTNNHEKGVDEPDIVKTDGEKIYALSQDQLRIVDTKTNQVTGSLNLASSEDSLTPSQLLLGDDHILIVLTGAFHTMEKPAEPGIADDKIAPDIAPSPSGSKVALVDISGEPQVSSSLTIEGEYVDARQVGDTVRLVTRSTPHLKFDQPQRQDEKAAIEHNQDVIENSTIDAWLPRYVADNGTTVSQGRVPCDNIAHPAEYSGGNLLSVFSFELGNDDIGTGDPLTIAADGGTVYSTGETLYVANEHFPNIETMRPGDQIAPADIRTEFYAFDIANKGQPEFQASGWVPGMLLNQYSMSDYQGYLRVATTSFATTATCCENEPTTESSVYVLKQDGGSINQVGSVSGLGKDEQIYAVRFVENIGYVVTFRQTDPLYTIDLSNPENPRTTGELKITGYSAYLHPAKNDQLIGVGQEASENGRRMGLQVSLFDVSDVSKPDRVAQHHVRDASSNAEFDPHAFLYWEKTGTLVIPLSSYATSESESSQPTRGALILKVGDGSLTEIGTISHPTADYLGQIQRSIMIDGTLWTVSDAGAMATDPADARQLVWVPFS